jgi:ABC-type oligopeptide transport system ATPase subunit
MTSAAMTGDAMTGDAMTAVLQAVELVKRYQVRGGGGKHHVTAVDHVSVDLVRGSTLGLVGESGSGKTTLGRLLLRLIQPDAGRLEFEGQRFDDVSGSKLRAMRPQLQMVFQSPYGSLNPRLSVLQIVEFNLRPLGLARSERRERAVAGLLQVGLTPAMMTRFPHELSGGQAQRVGIARAIVSGPKVIVADEVVSALDASVQGEILALLRQLRDRLKLATLFISHDLNVVRKVSDEIAVMWQGCIVERAPADVLFTDARHPYSKLLLASSPGRLDEMDVAEREQLRASLRGELASRRATSRLVEVAPGHLVGTGDPDGQSPDEQSPGARSPKAMPTSVAGTVPPGTRPPGDHNFGNTEASFATSRKEVE